MRIVRKSDKSALFISQEEWRKIGNQKRWFEKRSMAAWVPDDLRNVSEQSWFVYPEAKRGPKAIPEVGARELKAVDPNLLITMPKIYYITEKDIKEIDGRRYVVVDIESKKTDPKVIAIDVETGELREFLKEEVMDQLNRAIEGDLTETMEKANEEIRNLNDALDRIDNLTSDISRLPLQLGRVDSFIDKRVDDLNSMIEALQQKIDAPKPEVMTEWEQGIDEQIIGEDLSAVDFVDTILFKYMHNYNRLVEDLESGALVIPDHLPNPEIIRRNLENVARLGYRKVQEKNFINETMEQYRGRYRELIGAIDGGYLPIPEGLNEEKVKQTLKTKAENALGNVPFDIEGFDVTELRELALDDIPRTHKPEGYSSYGSYVGNLRAKIAGCVGDRDMLLGIKDALTRLGQMLGGLESGQRDNEYLATNPEGQAIVNAMEDFANNELSAFVNKYTRSIVDPASNSIDVKKMGRSGTIGNAKLAVVFARLYKVLSEIIRGLRTGEPTDPSRVPTDVDEILDIDNQEEVTESSSNDIDRLSDALWYTFDRRMGNK